MGKEATLPNEIKIGNLKNEIVRQKLVKKGIKKQETSFKKKIGTVLK